MSVKVRYRPSKSKTKVYLDIYIDGKRYQKPLDVYILPETDVFAINHNAGARLTINTMVEIAESEIKAGTFSFEVFKLGKDTAIDKILNDFINTKIADKTKLMYTNHINTIRKYADSSLTVHSFCDKKFLMGLLQYFRNNLASNTVILRIRTLKNLIKYLVEMELISKNIWHELPKHLINIKSQNTEIAFLTIDELKELANSNLQANIKMPFLFSAYTGLRFSDTFALKFSDIRDNVIHIKMQKTQSYNSIPLCRQAIEILQTQRELRPNNDIIFETVSGTLLHKNLKNTCKELFGKDIHYHCSRHSFAINALSLGMSITNVQSFLGHTNIQMTLRYAKVLPADKIQAIQIFDNI